MRKTQMHDKLRQFERESKLEIYGLGAKRIPWEAALEKYAELIVEECAKIADQHTHDGEWDIAKLIKQHFGLKEWTKKSQNLKSYRSW